MNKDHVLTTMLSLTEETLKHAKQHYADYLQSAHIDRQATQIFETFKTSAEREGCARYRFTD